MFKAALRPATRAALTFAVLSATSVFGARADQLPEIVVTADRVEEPIGQTGASVTVIHAAEVEKLGMKGVADVLRGAAGLDVVEAGGAGAVTQVHLRGATPGQTLVLIDGVRIGDASATDGSVDFGNLAPVDIDRIEILRGPQSALYGSDAMGGVINIITRKGSKAPRRNVTVEAGSYGTLSTRATLSGGDDRWTYSLGVNLLHSDGFPRYGYRIDRPLYDGAGDPLPPLPADDPTNKGGLAGRFSYKLSDSASIDAGFSLFGNALRFDNPYAYIASDVFSAYNHSQALIADGFVRANFDAPGGMLRNSLTAFSNVTDRNIWEAEGCYKADFTPFNCRSGYVGARYGVEYQGDLKLGGYGDFVFGARNETELARSSQSPDPHDGSFTPIDAEQITNSVFAEQRFKLFDRLDLTLGGRIDAIEGGQTFDTWRATAAYHIDETGTKLRASAGTGAKAATLYQRFSQFGFAGLAPEQSFGFDAGIDQTLFDGRATLSATVFDTRYRDLIDFAYQPGCTPAQVAAAGGCYYNVGRADIRGVELSGDVALVPDVWRARASYTYLDARDLDTNTQLLRRPRNKGALSLIYDGIAKLEVEGRLTLVGSRLDYNYPANVTLAPYAKLDVLANYKFDDNLAMFGRIENLTDARYEEVYNYGVAGRSYYAGISYSW
jgi:vitamin B12 transporter